MRKSIANVRRASLGIALGVLLLPVSMVMGGPKSTPSRTKKEVTLPKAVSSSLKKTVHPEHGAGTSRKKESKAPVSPATSLKKEVVRGKLKKEVSDAVLHTYALARLAIASYRESVVKTRYKEILKSHPKALPVERYLALRAAMRAPHAQGQAAPPVLKATPKETKALQEIGKALRTLYQTYEGEVRKILRKEKLQIPIYNTTTKRLAEDAAFKMRYERLRKKIQAENTKKTSGKVR